MKLRASNPMATRIARKDANKAGFPMTGIDIIGEGIGNGGDHLAAIMIWGQTEVDAKQRQAFIVRACNSHDALVAVKLAAEHLLSTNTRGKVFQFYLETLRERVESLKLAEGRE